MEVKILKGDSTIMKVSGRLDTVNAPAFGKQTIEGMDGAKHVVLDCSELSYVASSGLRQLLNLQKKANEQKADLTFRGVNDDIKSILTMTGFSSMFKLED
ncbi:MAG: STAS domain-containing protein [Prevotellaceae bacterium]|jgi:anti-anti-sigma factor|nr:STAS domain-containing protein [Prevotellaceae bacterium]